MPRLTRPPRMPEEVEVLIEILGNRARAQIVRTLSQRGPMTLKELAEEIDASTVTALRHLTVFEKAGLAVADVPAGKRHSQVVRWNINPERLSEISAMFTNFLAGAPLEHPEMTDET